MKGGAWMNSQNVITGSNHDENKINQFVMRKGASVIVHHVFNVSESITIGAWTCIAGYGSQIWTHSFVFGNEKAALVSKPVRIGNNCYIGSGCVICPGVTIVDNVVVGAHTTIAKSIDKSGLYVGQSIRYIPYDADAAVKTIEENHEGYVFNRNRNTLE